MNEIKALKKSLFILRLSVFIVMFMWTIDKFINPGHASKIFEKFYLISGLGNFPIYLIGGVQLLILLAFLFGVFKKYSYGFIWIIHFVSTISSWQKYIDPWSSPNLLFYAAIPMLAALTALYLLRDYDDLLTITALPHK